MRYAYVCDDEACSTETEVEHSMKESPKVPCPKCGGNTHRPLHATSFMIRGAGVYRPGWSFKNKGVKDRT